MRRRPADIRIRAIQPGDREWVAEEFSRHFGGVEIGSHDEWFDTRELPGYVALIDDHIVAAVVYTPPQMGGECEVIALASREQRRGAGGALLDACVAAAQSEGCRRVFLTTSNDNLAALKFYQKRGWRLVGIHRDAITRARARKPVIPLYGNDGIVIADEIELEYRL
ncbi:MAG: GNAT family N-acetyltransferase [Planctomycetes bacterium]|nr:GNAT family N-acetyltransferase [Planctomycetota bacterium]